MREIPPQAEEKVPLRHKFVKMIIAFTVFVFDYDVLRIYKVNKAKSGSYNNNPNIPIIKDTRLDELRRKFRKFIRIHFSIMIAYLAVVTITELIICLDSINTGQFRSELSKYAYKINDMLGYNISSIPEFSIFITTLSITCLIHVVHWQPYYFEKNPMDALYFRIFMSPQREIIRVDSAIKETLDDIELLISKTTQRLICELNYQMKNHNIIRMSILELLNLLKLIESLRGRIESMRPVMYCKEFIITVYDVLLSALFFYIIILIPWIFFFPYVLLKEAVRAHCVEFKWDLVDCDIVNYFSKNPHHFIGAIVLALSFGMIATSFGFLSIQIITNTFTQFWSIGEMRRDLNNCLKMLRFENQRDEELIVNTNELCEAPATGNELDLNQNDKKFNKDEGINLELLRTFIKLKLTDWETQKNFRYVSVLVTTLTCYIAYCLLLQIFFGGNLYNGMLGPFKVLFFYSNLLIGNVTLLGCAMSYSNAKKIDIKAWALLSEMIIKCDRRGTQFSNGYIETQWYRLIKSQHLSNRGKTVDIFDMLPVTHAEVLRLDFILLSLYSLIKQSF